LIIEGVFSKSNPLGVLLADLYDEGMVKTVSVGFIPKQRQEDNRRIITSAELLELSFVAVPCNPNALSLDQKQLMKKGIEAGILQEEKSELEAFKAEILGEVAEVKNLLRALLDGKSKGADEANYIAKETLQNIAKAANEGISMFKKAVRG
jgi:caudovirus prohead protease